MANVAKYDRVACGHMLAHYERVKDANGQYVKFKNQNIDLSRTKLNYNLAPDHGMSGTDFIKKRIDVDNVHILNRKDVNVMCTWVVTKPTDYKGDSRLFFESVYEFLENLHGKENVISAYVHLDETTDHMHFAFTPVVEDPKRGGYKFHAKSAVNNTLLKTFHKDLDEHLQSKGIHCSILNEATKEGNKAIDEMKRLDAPNRLQNLKNDISDLEELRTTLKGDVHVLEDIANVGEGKLSGFGKIIMPKDDVKNMKYTIHEQAKQIEEQTKVIQKNSDIRSRMQRLVQSEEFKLGRALLMIRNEMEEYEHTNPRFYKTVMKVLDIVERCKSLENDSMDVKLELLKQEHSLDEPIRTKTKSKNISYEFER